MKTINGFTYSKTPFERWKFRAKIEILFDGLSIENRSINIYTSCENKWECLEAVKTVVISKYISLKILNWVSKADDELTAKFIEETLKNW